MTREPLTVTIITLNEEQRILYAIQSVKWADEVIVVDSGSIDRTVEIAKSLGARVVHNPWTGYGQQKNFAQSLATHPWVLNIDADEVVPHPLAEDIQEALRQVQSGQSKAKGFYFPRKTFYLGRWIQHGGWYPNYLVRLADDGSLSGQNLTSMKHSKCPDPLLHFLIPCITMLFQASKIKSLPIYAFQNWDLKT